VSRLRDELAAAAGTEVVEVTAKTTDDELAPGARIHIGTEAVLHRLSEADVVAFLDLDQELNAPRYRAGEQALGLLARAARLVGGRPGSGRLLVQTRTPRHEVLDAVLHADPGRLAAVELPRREALGFPPARALAALTGAGAAEYAGALLAAGADVLGPADGTYLVRAADGAALAGTLASVVRPAGTRVEVGPRRV
jgi:primosomal protein N' (replication factor Y)